ncbi:hypothetical protein ACFLVZ_00005, partial [Chloroflexota bacterium]
LKPGSGNQEGDTPQRTQKPLFKHNVLTGIVINRRFFISDYVITALFHIIIIKTDHWLLPVSIPA